MSRGQIELEVKLVLLTCLGLVQATERGECQAERGFSQLDEVRRAGEERERHANVCASGSEVELGQGTQGAQKRDVKSPCSIKASSISPHMPSLPPT